MTLMKFVCSFAWADLEVQDEERRFVAKVMNALDLSEGERAQVQSWLDGCLSTAKRPEKM